MGIMLYNVISTGVYGHITSETSNKDVVYIVEHSLQK